MPRDRGARGIGHASAVSALAIAVYTTFAVGAAALSREPGYATPLWSMVSLFAGGIAVLAAHRRLPKLAFAGALVLPVLSLAVGSGAECLLAVLAVYTVGVRRSGPIAWLCFVAALASGALGAFALILRGQWRVPLLGLGQPTVPRDTVVDWTNYVLVITVVLVIAALLGTTVGHRRRHIAELVDRAERLARERDQQAETARALERERIAREMHDVIAHSLSVIIAISDGAYAAADERPQEAKEAIGRVAETGRKTLAEVRRLLGSVREERGGAAMEHAPQPDASHLPALVTEFVAAGLAARLDVSGSATTDPALGLTVYRIVQESLTNVLRHAGPGREVVVSVSWHPDAVGVVVLDTPVGGGSVGGGSDGGAVSGGGLPRAARVPSAIAGGAASGAGRGILGMHERVALYDGTLEAGPHGDGGWRVLARLRWEEER